MKSTSEDPASKDTDSDRVLAEEDAEVIYSIGSQEDTTVSFATKKTLPTWYRRLMSAFRADLNACRHVDLARLVHQNTVFHLQNICISNMQIILKCDQITF